MAAMTLKIYAHKQEMDFEGKSHLSVAVKVFTSPGNILYIYIAYKFELY